MTSSVEVEQYFVTASWVARHYGVSKLAVYRAIAARRLIAAKIRGDGRDTLLLDSRELPATFPHGPQGG